MVFTISAVTTLAHANNAMPPKVGESDGVVCRRKPPKDAERADSNVLAKRANAKPCAGES